MSRFDYQSPLAVPQQGVLVEFVDFLATHLQIHDEATQEQM